MPFEPADYHGRYFANRRQGGVHLAKFLREYAGRSDVVVLGLPRGGVPVACEVARSIGAPLDVFGVRTLGVPGHRELAMGAIASGGVRVLNEGIVSSLDIPQTAIDAVTAEETRELQRRERVYRDGRPLQALKNRVVILVDDGLATGSTMRAAVHAVRRFEPARVVVAVPVGAPETCRELQRVADEVICARMPARLSSVAQWYIDFSETTDEEVRALLRTSAPEPAVPGVT